MVDDALKLTLDTRFKKKTQEPSKQPVESFQVDGYEDDQSIWRLIM